MFARLVVYPLVVYVVVCVYLYSFQTSMLYPIRASGALISTEQASETAHAYGLIPWDKTTPGSTGPQGYVQSHFSQPAARGTIVVFHGNGGWAVDRLGYVQALTRRGFRVFLYEYPGYGGRPGRPSEKTIVPDAQAFIRSLDQAGFGPIYVWGESLGSGVAAAVCADPKLPVHGLVLFLPWDNLANVGLSFYPYIPVRLLLTDKYDSVANLVRFPHPICVVRSDNDEIIPPRLTLNLYDKLPEPKKMIVHANSSHNEWPSDPSLAWWDEALDFIAPK